MHDCAMRGASKALCETGGPVPHQGACMFVATDAKSPAGTVTATDANSAVTGGCDPPDCNEHGVCVEGKCDCELLEKQMPSSTQ